MKKLNRTELRKLILEQTARPVTINPDSDEAKEIENAVETLLSDEGGAVAIDSEELENTLKSQGVDDPTEYVAGNPEFIELRDGDVISKQQLKTESFHLTPTVLRKIIIQELAELVIEPDSPCAMQQKSAIDQHDQEGAMAKRQLDRAASLAHSLSDRMIDDAQLPSWVQAKITKAADYIQSVYNYLDEDLTEGKKKKKKKSPAKDFLYPYAYGIGRRPDYEEDEDDAQLDAFVFGDVGSFEGGGEGAGGE